MSTAIRSLERLQQELDRRSRTEWWNAAVSFSEADGLIAVEFFGYTGEPLERLFETLGSPEVARALGALSFAGEDEGANGSKEWDFTPLLKQEVMFPNLHTLAIELQLEQYNHPIVGDGLEENGQLARWLDLAPQLRTLCTPSAPDARFFQRPAHPLRSLQVQAGYTSQGFIPHLAQSCCFPALQELDWTEIEAWDLDVELEYDRRRDELSGRPWDPETAEWMKQSNEEEKEKTAPTSFEQFETLLCSAACPPTVTLRDPILTSDQAAHLQRTFQSRHPGGSLRILSPHTDPSCGAFSANIVSSSRSSGFGPIQHRAIPVSETTHEQLFPAQRYTRLFHRPDRVRAALRGEPAGQEAGVAITTEDRRTAGEWRHSPAWVEAPEQLLVNHPESQGRG